MPKTTLRHLTSSGRIDTRKTARRYSHVVVRVDDTDARLAAQRRSNEKNSGWHLTASPERVAESRRWQAHALATIEALRGVHYVVSWSSSEALACAAAQDAARRWNNCRFYVEAVNHGIR